MGDKCGSLVQCVNGCYKIVLKATIKQKLKLKDRNSSAILYAKYYNRGEKKTAEGSRM